MDIVMEKAKGTLVSDCWYSLEKDRKNRIIRQIVDLEALLASKCFTMHPKSRSEYTRRPTLLGPCRLFSRARHRD